MFIVRIIVIAIIALSGITQAASLNDAMQDCAKIKRDLMRLACFDKLSGKVDTYATEALQGQVATTDTTKPAATAPATTTSQPASTAEDNFGLKEDSTTVLYSTIPGEFSGWRPGDKITLANGQVWQISKSASRFFYKATNPRIEIRPGSFGSFILKVEGMNRTEKVRRLK